MNLKAKKTDLQLQSDLQKICAIKKQAIVTSIKQSM